MEKMTFHQLIQVLRVSSEKQCLDMLESETRPLFRKQIYGRFNRLRNRRERIDLMLKANRRCDPQSPKQNLEETADFEVLKKLLDQELSSYRRASVARRIHVRLCKVRSKTERENNWEIIKW